MSLGNTFLKQCRSPCPLFLFSLRLNSYAPLSVHFVKINKLFGPPIPYYHLLGAPLYMKINLLHYRVPTWCHSHLPAPSLIIVFCCSSLPWKNCSHWSSFTLFSVLHPLPPLVPCTLSSFTSCLFPF